MKMLSKIIGIGVCASLTITSLGGCAQQVNDPDFSNVKEVAKLSSLECFYHNVVKYHKDADGILFGLGNIGEKNMWLEYDGIVQMGIDVEKVEISSPDANNVVTVTLPDVEVLGHPDVETDSMTDPVEANGWFTGMSADDKKKALSDAQANLLETAQNDTQSRAQAMERAKNLIEQYVKNVGEAIGKAYTVKWNQLEEK